jgi:hypothetical protein
LTDTADRIQECDYGFDTLALRAGQEVDPTTTDDCESIGDILYDLDNALNGA